MKKVLEILFDNESDGRVFKAPDGKYIALRYGFESGDSLIYTDDETVAKEAIGLYDWDDKE